MEDTMEQQTYPNESPEYRKARNDLLQAESDLRDQVEAVAELRRKRPGQLPYTRHAID